MAVRDLGQTESLCPVCLERIDACRVERDGQVFLEKTCPRHGDFSTPIWRGDPPLSSWYRKVKRPPRPNSQTEIMEGCPYDCGLCPDHRQGTCTAVLEVTSRCDLRCRFCFAGAGEGEHVPIKELSSRLEALSKRENCTLQLSGGEPTTRDDLAEVVSTARSMGFDFVQLNTNGIRISQDRPYLAKLARAGLSSVYLQFDGDDEANLKLRGRPLFKGKDRAISNCAIEGIGVVLVTTLVPGCNLDQVGSVISYGMGRSPAVRGVHFQPVSHFGRVPKVPDWEDRITLPEVMAMVEDQTGGLFQAKDLIPPG